MTRDLLAAAGILLLLWTALQRLIPDLAEWRANELQAWSAATRQTQRRLLIVWRLHWQTYRAMRP